MFRSMKSFMLLAGVHFSVTLAANPAILAKSSVVTTTTSPTTTTVKSTTSTTKKPPTTTPIYQWADDGSDYYDPQVNFTACNLGSKSWVCNTDNILGARDASSLNEYIKKYVGNNNVKCVCDDKSMCIGDEGRWRISVAVVKKLWDTTGIDGSPQSKIDRFALALRNDIWKKHYKCDDAVVIALVTDENKRVYNASPSGKASKILTDGCLKRIYQKVEDDLDSKNYFTLLKRLVRYYGKSLREGHCVDTEPVGMSSGIICAIVFGLLGSFLVLIYLLLLVVQTHKNPPPYIRDLPTCGPCYALLNKCSISCNFCQRRAGPKANKSSDEARAISKNDGLSTDTTKGNENSSDRAIINQNNVNVGFEGAGDPPPYPGPLPQTKV